MRWGRYCLQGRQGVFMHGPTFMANPLACNVADRSLELLENMGWKKAVDRIESELEQGLSPCREMEHVQDVRVLGAIGVVEMKKDVDMASIQKDFVENGVWVRPFGKLVYLMPPYIISAEELDFLTMAVCRVVEKHG